MAMVAPARSGGGGRSDVDCGGDCPVGPAVAGAAGARVFRGPAHLPSPAAGPLRV